MCKTTINGKKIFELNYPKEIKDYNSEKDFKPTETCIAPNGDIYVADGYGKDFIIRYDSNGNYIGHFGGKGDKNENFDPILNSYLVKIFNKINSKFISSYPDSGFLHQKLSDHLKLTYCFRTWYI